MSSYFVTIAQLFVNKCVTDVGFVKRKNPALFVNRLFVTVRRSLMIADSGDCISRICSTPRVLEIGKTGRAPCKTCGGKQAAEATREGNVEIYSRPFCFNVAAANRLNLMVFGEMGFTSISSSFFPVRPHI